MSPRDVLAAVRAAGFELEPDGAHLSVLGDGDVPTDVLALIHGHKGALLALLRADGPGPTCGCPAAPVGCTRCHCPDEPGRPGVTHAADCPWITGRPRGEPVAPWDRPQPSATVQPTAPTLPSLPTVPSVPTVPPSVPSVPTRPTVPDAGSEPCDEATYLHYTKGYRR
jgi:hypothetical protein